MPSISVIIPCYNEENYIGKLLDNIARQTRQPDEVIIADCQSEDRTVVVAKKHQAKLPLQIVKCLVHNPGAARNAGATHANGDYFIFIDADMAFPADFLERIDASLAAKPVDYLSPKWRSSGRILFEVCNLGLINRWQWISAHVTHKPAGIGGVMCVRAEAFRKVGGFEAELLMNEDVRLTKRLGEIGASFTYLDHTVAIYSDRRIRKDGLLSMLLRLHADNGTWFGAHVVGPLQRRLHKNSEYGHYDH